MHKAIHVCLLPDYKGNEYQTRQQITIPNFTPVSLSQFYFVAELLLCPLYTIPTAIKILIANKVYLHSHKPSVEKKSPSALFSDLSG